MKKQLLIVEDDPLMAEAAADYFKGKGWEAETAGNGPEALERFGQRQFHLILLDVMMPGTDGFTLCEKLRCRVDCPILFLTARSEESSLVFGLEKGADDYICKPFGAAELRARVAAHLRRERREHFSGISFEKARFNFSSKQLLVEESVMPLTRAEYAICEFLARNHGQVFSK